MKDTWPRWIVVGLCKCRATHPPSWCFRYLSEISIDWFTKRQIDSLYNVSRNTTNKQLLCHSYFSCSRLYFSTLIIIFLINFAKIAQMLHWFALLYAHLDIHSSFNLWDADDYLSSDIYYTVSLHKEMHDHAVSCAFI